MQELEKILEEIESKKFTNMTIKHSMVVKMEDVRDIIRKHMNDGWISVKDRLPEGRTRVICQFDNGDIELLWQDWESDLKTLTYLTDFDFMAEKKVIAWRPLPEPCRPERSVEE